LKDAGLETSVGSVGDSYDNALAQTIDGLYPAEVSWRSVEAVEFDTLKWTDGFTITGCWSRPETSRRPRPKCAIMRRGGTPWRRDSEKTASEKAGAFQPFSSWRKN
jgi:hypothetical protein